MAETMTEVALRDGGTVLLRPMAADDTVGVRALRDGGTVLLRPMAADDTRWSARAARDCCAVRPTG